MFALISIYRKLSILATQTKPTAKSFFFKQCITKKMAKPFIVAMVFNKYLLKMKGQPSLNFTMPGYLG